MSSKITTEWMLVTPELAQAWLNLHNKKNRNVRERVVEVYARDMIQGRWKETGDSIRFDWNGVLLDGQHRLHAVILSGHSTRFLVLRGLEPEVQDAIDIGVPRTVADALMLRGHRGSNRSIGAIGRNFLIFEEGVAPTKPELTDFTEKHYDELAVAASLVTRCKNKSVNGGATLGAAYYRCRQLDPADADFFFERLAEGDELSKGDAALTLRNHLTKHRFRAINDTNSRRVQGMVFHAWNTWRTGRKLRSVVVPAEMVWPA